MSYGYDFKEPVAGEKVKNNRLFYIGLDDTNQNVALIKIRQENGSIVTSKFFKPEDETTELAKRQAKDMFYRVVDFLQVVYDRKDVVSALKSAETFQDLWNIAMGLFRDKQEEFNETAITCKFTYKFSNGKYYLGLPKFGACVEFGGVSDEESKLKTSDKVDGNGVPYDLYEKNVEVEA
jgi:hypothetical protein